MKAEIFDSRRFQDLRQDWSSEANTWFFLLSSEDMLHVFDCRGAQNRLSLGTALIIAISVHKCHLLLTTMADVAVVRYQQLTYISDLYIREETILCSINALENYRHLLPLATAIGNSSTASTYRIRFLVSAHLFHAQYCPGYLGSKQNVIIHAMAGDQNSHPCLQLIHVHFQKTYVPLDMISHCNTELSLLAMTDTQYPFSP
jgi:hypothetical protein